MKTKKMDITKIDKLFKYTIEKQHSDMHIWEKKHVFIRNNIWDIEKLNMSISKDEILKFANNLLLKSKYNELIEWFEVDAWYSFMDNRFRLNFYYDKEWLNIAIRKIALKPPTLSEVWIPNNLNKFFLKSKWLILVTWPTGSWKSTTMAAIIKYINENKKSHIITLEDPIEYIFDSDKSRITQREVWRNTSSWLNWIKYAMRQDPDIIVVWEMRDYETISAVLTLVETWHLVISTLHSIDAVQTISRIIDSFPYQQQPQIATQLSMALEIIISQRLLPKSNWKWKTAIREILINNSAISNIIRDKKIANIYWILETQWKSWMTTMDTSLAKMIFEWTIKYEDWLSVVKNKENLDTLLIFYKQQKEKNEKRSNW